MSTKKLKSSPVVDEAILQEMFRNICLTRSFESKCIELYRQGMISGYLHPYTGEEAIAAGVCAAIGKGAYITSTHRGHGHCISKGAEIKYMMAEITGKATGYCKGYGGSMHISRKVDNNLGANGIVGAGMPIAVGAAMGLRVKGINEVSVAFFSDGASNNGTFGESLNFASVFNLPVIFVLENNHYAVSTPVECSSGCCELANHGPAYGMPGICIDGNDAEVVYLETKNAVERAKKGEGPTLIEAKTYRHGGHHVNDPGLYMDPDILSQWKARDPLILLKEKIDPAAARKIEEAVAVEIEEAVVFSKNSPEPSVEEFLAEIEN